MHVSFISHEDDSETEYENILRTINFRWSRQLFPSTRSTRQVLSLIYIQIQHLCDNWLAYIPTTKYDIDLWHTKKYKRIIFRYWRACASWYMILNTKHIHGEFWNNFKTNWLIKCQFIKLCRNKFLPVFQKYQDLL